MMEVGYVDEEGIHRSVFRYPIDADVSGYFSGGRQYQSPLPGSVDRDQHACYRQPPREKAGKGLQTLGV
jgi:hypothetical protein